MAAGRLAGRVTVVTGAASGIGLATAQLFAAEGASVALVDRDGAALDTAVAALGAALAIEADVSDEAAAATGVARVVERWGRIDALVTAAAISVGKRLGETMPEEWDRVFAVNVRGTYLWVRAVLPVMVAVRGGTIVTVASQLALAGGRQSAAYVASKGAILSLTRSVAVDYASQGIRANTLVPGAVETPFLERGLARAASPEDARAASMARHAIGRFGTADEVARAALFLAGDESSFTTGAELRVDGGWLAG